MRYIVTLFWAVVLGQVVGYIGAALTSGLVSLHSKKIW